MNAFAEGRYDLARVYFAEDLERNPARLESQRGLALSWLSGPGQSLEPAQRVLESYLAAAPEEDAEMRRRHARNLLLLGDWDGVRRVAEALEPGIESALLLAESLAEEAPQRALAHLQPHQDGDDARVSLLAASLASRLEDPQRALAHAERAVELAPLNASAWYTLGRLQLAMGRRGEAAVSLGVHRGLEHMSRGGPEGGPLPAIEGLRVMRELEDALPTSPEVRLRGLRLRLEAGFVEEARGGLTEVIEQIDPEEGLRLAELLHRRGELGTAETLYRRGLEHRPESRLARGGLASLLLAQGHEAIGEAGDLIASGLEKDPHLARYHLLQGRWFLAKENRAAAEASMTRALELAPWNVPGRLALAELKLAAGDRRSAEAVLDGAPEPSPALDRFRQSHGLNPGNRP